jgi:acetyl-CoA/propionyl-CoA carboxylase, biotin carboxylase, biotin carboxyl carrier protein
VLTKVLVANRGEIAVRVARTCRELGIRSVAVHSEADAAAMHVREADESVGLPGSSAAETYLNIAAVVAAALDTGADAIHPGYGFLSENPLFAAAAEAAGITLIGPPATAIAVMADKISARALAAEAGLPVLPSLTVGRLTVDELRDFGAATGWPVIVKASRGGGGRGLRVADGPDAAAEALAAARAEALAAAGDDTVYAEKYLPSPRHVEVQLLAGADGQVIALGERDCSVQRRHQKLVEEAPAAALAPALRLALAEAAVALARRVGYVGAGTVEFLVDGGQFFFLEMNTRIQVEHPVTELVFGLDLVREQLLIAGGCPSAVSEPPPLPRGHAIEVRVNAEDPHAGFLPVPGLITALTVPLRPGVRFDTGYEPGDEVTGHFDSLVGKLMVWAPTREIAIRRLREVIADTVVAGIPTGLAAATAVLAHPDFARPVSTQWFEQTVVPDLASGEAASAQADAAATGRQIAHVGAHRYRVPRFGAAASAGEPDRAAGLTLAAPPVRRADPDRDQGPDVLSPMYGTVIAARVLAGASVATGDVLVTLESMKMEQPVRAHRDGVVESVLVAEGDVVNVGTPLVRLGPAATAKEDGA